MSQTIIDASAIFEVPVDELRPARDADVRGRYRSSASRRPADEWAMALFAPEVKRAWINAGLGEHDVRLAEDCAKEGLTPDDLHQMVDGRTIVARLRGGESLRQVVARMQEAKGNRGSQAG
ncbi:MAG: hypothetical protein NVS3B1_26960 [Marmoricola sp.]